MDKLTAVAKQITSTHFEVAFSGGEYNEKILGVDFPEIKDPQINLQEVQKMLIEEALKNLGVTGYELTIIF